MDTAFQPDAFQNDAFQIAVTPPVGGAGGGSASKRGSPALRPPERERENEDYVVLIL